MRQMGQHVRAEDVLPRDRDDSPLALRAAQAERPVPVVAEHGVDVRWKVAGASLRNMSGANLDVRVTAETAERAHAP